MRRLRSVLLGAGAIVAIAMLCVRAADAETAAAPAASPSPSPTRHGLSLAAELNVVFFTQGASGPGLLPVEGPAFASGAPAAPISPYDLLSGAPMVPGNVQQDQFAMTASWDERSYRATVVLGAEALVGDRTGEAYWVEPLEPQDNPHLGSTATGFSIVFPTRPGTDDYTGTRLGVSQASLSTDDDRLTVTGGWFDLTQTLGCVFNPTPTTNAVPGLLLKTPESANPDSIGLSDFTSASTLPMRGFDAVYDRSGPLTFEASDAELPSPPGTPARIETVSAGHFDDDGHGAIVQLIRAFSGGYPISTTLGFGAAPQIIPSDQGLFATSALYGQRETIAGGKAVLPVAIDTDATLEYARSSYSADGLGKPGSAAGAWEHGALTRTIGDATVGLHYYRFEPTFATMVLPYGVPENVWSVAYSWPGPWLKSNYQLVDPSVLGVNREGPMLSYSRDANGITIAATYSDFRQIQPFTTADIEDLGFIDGFFLVQRNPAQSTLGDFHRTTAYVGKAVGAVDVGFDFVDDGLHRDAASAAPLDAVSYDAPQYILSVSHSITTQRAVVFDYGWYGMRGSWADGAATNVDYGMRFGQVGEQYRDRGGDTMITLRRSVMGGAPYFGSLHLVDYGSPDFTATTLLIERRYRL
jgi:hypothetical protein